MRRVFRFRLYPTERQEERMTGMLETCRRLWNDALWHRKDRWSRGEKTTYLQQQAILTQERKNDERLKGLYSQVGQDVLRRLDLAYRRFFEGIAKAPRFKRFGTEGSFTFPQAYNGSVLLGSGKVRLAGVGQMTIVQHREVPRDGLLKICTVRREGCNEWYAVPVYDTEEPEPVEKEVFDSPVGIDLGLKAIVTASDGMVTEPPRFLRKAEKRLRRLQRRLSRKQKGSKNREKARRLVAVQHAKVRRQRENFNHVLSARIVKAHDLVGFEDLSIKNMVKNHALAKSIHDAGWAQLMTFAQYKERARGGLAVLVDPPYTTQDCFWCGFRNSVALSQREFGCGGCGRPLPRDRNASRNVLRKTVEAVGIERIVVAQGMREFTPVETGVQPSKRMAQPVGEAGTAPSGGSPGL